MFSVKVSKIVENLKLEKLYYNDQHDDIEVSSSDVNRPGLQLMDFFDYFDPTRIEVIGKVEMTYLETMEPDARAKCLYKLFSKKFPMAVICRGMTPHPELVAAAEKYDIPLLRTDLSTSRFMSEVISNLNVWLAPRITRHGVLVEIYGEGILIIGESGVGKSETAIELLKRGHRLVADDAVEIKKVSNRTLVASSPKIIQHFIELRGIGIVNVKNIFGMGAVKDTENVDLVVNLEQWRSGIEYDRLGLENEYTDILGVKVPQITIPVKRGRNLAVILEVAAMNNRQKRMGISAAQELNQRLTESMMEDN